MPTWSKVDTISLEGHIDDVIGGAVLSDGSHVVTGTRDGSLCVWRAADGVQTAIYECGNVCQSIVFIYHSPLLLYRWRH